VKSLRLALAAVALATTVAPGVASAGVGCTIWYTYHPVGPVIVGVPHCAW